MFFVSCSGDHRDLPVLPHPFRTRLSSALMRIVSPSDSFVSMAKCFCYNGHRHTLEGQTSTVSAAEVMKAGFWKLRGFTGLCQRSGLLRWPPFLSIRSEKNNLSGRLPDGEFLEQTHAFRSEEHTSELQSLMRISYAVFCLKKKKTKTEHQ